MITQPAVPESRRDRIQRAAVEVARRYRVLGHDAPREGAAAFYLMLDLITFFDLCHANKLDEALDTVEKIKVGGRTRRGIHLCSTFKLRGNGGRQRSRLCIHAVFFYMGHRDLKTRLVP